MRALTCGIWPNCEAATTVENAALTVLPIVSRTRRDGQVKPGNRDH
jgi:hypothetical protein